MHLVFWHWWILAAVLLIGEMLSFTSFLLWISFGAIITGIVSWFAPAIDWQWQLVLFALLAIIGVGIAFVIFKNRRKNKVVGQETLNSRAKSHIGKTYVLVTPIVNSSGKIKVGDTYWLVHCDSDLPEKSKVKVIDANGATLIVSLVK